MILAGITINLTIGENGIFNRAKQAKADYQIAANQEAQELALLDALIESEIQPEGEIPEDAIARIKTQYYTSLQNAIDAVPADNTQTIIHLLKDTSENVNIAQNKKIILNLSNKKLTNLSSESPIIELEGNLTLKDGSILGTFTQKVATIKVAKNSNLDIVGTQIDRKSETDYSWETIEMRGNLNISSGKIYNDISNAICTYSDSDIINITGGTIETESYTVISNRGTLIIENGTITNKTGNTIYNKETGQVDITGGTITTENANSISNYGTLKISGTANIGNNSASKPTVYNQSTGNITIEGGTITSNNSTMPIYNKADGQVTITGGTITTGDANSINNHGTLKISGTANISNNSSSNYPTIYNQSTGNVTIEGGTINSQNSVEAIYNKADGQVSITGGTITAGDANSINNYGILKISGTANISNNSATYPTIYNESTGNITIEGGTITTGDTNSIKNLGTLKISGTANISNNSSSKPTIYNESTGNLTIEGGTINSKNSAITISNQADGQIDIKGGTITAGNANAINNYGTLKISGTANISNNSATYPTIYNESTGNLTIENGTITNNGTDYAVYNDGGTVSVTGGTISSKNF